MPIPVTDAYGNITAVQMFNPANGAFPALNYIAQCYNNYRLENVSAAFVSNQGYNAGGNLHTTFINNPEVIGKGVFGAITNMDVLIMNSIGSMSTHVTDPCVTRDVLPTRRRWYSNDSCLSVESSDSWYNTLDRSVQTALAFQVKGAGANTSVGYFRVTGTCVFEGLSPVNLAIACSTDVVSKSIITYPHADGSYTTYDTERGLSVTYAAPAPQFMQLPTVSQSMEVDEPSTV
jgi:hypothetical protein